MQPTKPTLTHSVALATPEGKTISVGVIAKSRRDAYERARKAILQREGLPTGTTLRFVGIQEA